jgi:hypothetical protein
LDAVIGEDVAISGGDVMSFNRVVEILAVLYEFEVGYWVGIFSSFRGGMESERLGEE